MSKIIVVIVTYNRLTLLIECIQALQKQSVQSNKIIIINNASTDGTKEYLEKECNSSLFLIKNLDDNIGGAGGFSEGIKIATAEGADWIWVMDDDTIPNPDSLEKLLDETNENTGFVCSKVVWTDGMEHIMNIPNFRDKEGQDKATRLVSSASFVSLLINAKVVKKIGLPYRDFFIWGDDSEYTKRISEKGYECKYVRNSVVLHKTAANYGPDISSAPYNTAWKFYYNMRNTIFQNRNKYSSEIVFYIKELNHLRLAFYNIGKRPANERKNFYKAIIRGFIDGLTFSPKIEFVNPDKE